MDFKKIIEDNRKMLEAQGNVDYDHSMAFFLKYAQEHDPGFLVDENNFDAIRAIIGYYGKDPDFLVHKACGELLYNDPSFEKGILLIGPVGTGKTLIMRVFSDIMRVSSIRGRYFQLVSARHISREVGKSGQKEIDRWGTESYRKPYSHEVDLTVANRLPKLVCFDDMGAENKVKYYGNNINPIAEIICDRYEEMPKGMITHGTTNLELNELEEFYGTRVFSRMLQMFNFIRLVGKDRRK